MKGKFKFYELHTLAKNQKGAISGGPFGSDLVTTDYVRDGVPVIRGQNLSSNTQLSLKNIVFVTESKADKLKYNCAYPGDIVFTQRGTLGQVGIIPKAKYKRYLISQSQMKMAVDKSKADTKFIYYFFRLKGTTEYIKNIALQSGVPHINLGILKKIKIPTPSLPIQKKIAAVLSAYDDLIENNNRRIAILEKMAEEVYREWFVRLRFPGHEKVKVVKGVPEGWKVKKLKDIAVLNYGKSLIENNRVDGPYPVYGSSGIVGYHNKALVSGPGIVIGRKGNVGNVIWSDKDFYPIDTTYFIESNLDLKYLFHLLKSLNFINNDAAVPGLNRDQAYSNPFLLPEPYLIGTFSKLVTPLQYKISKLKNINELLKQSRDRLLSRLMSGKIDVEHLDIQFPESMMEEMVDA
jgi:type I restriction enzyme, S subunit